MDTISKETQMNEKFKFINELLDSGAMENFFTEPGKVAGKRVRVKDIDGNYQTLCMEVSYTAVKDRIDKL